jgi:pimeloyl-ACP methyl ester carboxylesterase
MVLKVIGILLALLVVGVAAAWLSLRGPDIPYATLEARYGGPTSHFVDLPGGYHVHYREDGPATTEGPGTEGSGAPGGAPLLVLLHGYGDSFTTWEGWVAELKPKFRIISLDFPGHGLTRAPDGSILSLESLADLVDTFADRLSLPKFAVAGNSMGGGVAWQLAVRHPQRIDALILLDAAGFPNEKPAGETPLAFRILQYPIGRALLRNIDNRPLIREGLKTDVYDKALITPALIDRWAAFQRAPGHRAILMAVNLGSVSNATPALLSTIKVPTLIQWGEYDPLIEPAAAGKFAAAIAGAKLIMYPNVGHLPQIEIPRRSAADAAAFLAAALP